MFKGLTVPAVPDLAAILRSLLGVLAVAVVALNWGPANSATVITTAAAVAGATGLQDSPRGRMPLVVLVSLLMGLAVLLGASTSGSAPAFVAAVALWSFLAAMHWALSAHAGLVAAASVALMVITVPAAPTLSSTLGVSALVVAGGLVQAGLVVAWPRRRWRVQREALAAAYRSLAADAAMLAEQPPGSAPGVDTKPLISLRSAFTVTDAQGRRPAEYRNWYRLPERIAITLAGTAGRPDLSDVLTAAAETLTAFGETGRSARSDTDAAIRRLDTAVAQVAGPDAPLARRLAMQLHEAVAIRLGDFVPSSPDALRIRRPELRTSLGSALELTRAHLNRHSPVFRHAIRLTTTVAIGTAIERYIPVAQGYWIPLTVLLVLRPETAHTYTRCAGRLAGIVAGILVASTVLFVQPGPVVSAVLAVALVGVAYAVAGFGYVALSAALTAAVVLLINIDRAANAASVGALLLAALAGGVLAILAHVLLPDDALTRLGQRAGELLRTEIDYAATVIKGYVHELDNPTAAASAAWARAFRARAAFEASAGATRMESRDLRRWLSSYRTALNAVTASCTTLEVGFPGNLAGSWSPEFVLAVDEYVESLCGDPPTPASPWTVDIEELTDADQRLRDAVSELGREIGAARVLVTEVGTITHHLSMVAGGPGPTAGR
ncbi:MAG: FUSC family protein [Mycolicibacterium sp.]|uniref:FUSC family protein n=1 Tax=Mycolicibacterium sp. TaxID=2320850 RepID=UPI003D0D4A5B